jgi:AraC-like DNA-binding protein
MESKQTSLPNVLRSQRTPASQNHRLSRKPSSGAKADRQGLADLASTKPPKQLGFLSVSNSQWVCPKSAQLDLLYLAWSRQRYGRNPVPVSRHSAWRYMLVNHGNPTLVLDDHEQILSPGDFVIIAPDCASGLIDQSDEVSDLLIWLWRTPPGCAECEVSPRAYRQWSIGPHLWHKLEECYRLCQEEVARPDELSKLAIKQLHCGIDLTVARLVRCKTQPPEAAVRMELAIHWMAYNLGGANPVGDLCKYLRISRATLIRMFQTQYGEPPGIYHRRLKMSKARELLQTGRFSIKEVAFALGYQHANDFSRAFKQFSGERPTAICDVSNQPAAAIISTESC